MRTRDTPCRVVITGVGLVCPFGNDLDSLWDALRSGRSAVAPLESLPSDAYPFSFGAEARGFDGSIANFGPLEKPVQRAIKKGLKVMCREIEMGVAAAQLALTDAKLDSQQRDPDRTGVLFGSDYIMTLPQEFTDGIRKCQDADGKFDFERWGQLGLPEVNPLWLLKYLPNMPASHVAIYNDLRGANNSLTLRDASAAAAIGEAVSTISRGIVDAMVVGATGTRINPFRTLHVAMQEPVASGDGDPTTYSRPFDKSRTGCVLGEGAGAIVLEELEFAQQRGANILAEVVGFGSSTVGKQNDENYLKSALTIAMRSALHGNAEAGANPANPAHVGHINAHGLGTRQCDAQEAAAIVDVFGAENNIPVVAPKANFGNLGAGSGMVEAIASLRALAEGTLWPMLNYETPDPECPICVAMSNQTPAGDSFLSMNVTPQGQATAIRIAQYRP